MKGVVAYLVWHEGVVEILETVYLVWDGVSDDKSLTHLHEFPGQVIGEELLFLLIIDGERFLLLLKGLDLLEERVADELLLLFGACLLQIGRGGGHIEANNDEHTDRETFNHKRTLILIYTDTEDTQNT